MKATTPQELNKYIIYRILKVAYFSLCAISYLLAYTIIYGENKEYIPSSVIGSSGTYYIKWVDLCYWGLVWTIILGVILFLIKKTFHYILLNSWKY